MPALLANENFPMPALQLLRDTGLDILSIAESAPGSQDEEVLAKARREGRWLLTFDRDYGELVFKRHHAPPPAIIYIRQGPYPPVQAAEMVLELIRSPKSVEGFFVVLSGTTVRLRALPKVS